MKDITLRITGKTIDSEDHTEDTVQFTTQGTMQKRGNIIRISYQETEISGMEGCTTSLVMSSDKVKMTRSGGFMENPTVMEFCRGKRYEGLYETPYGPVGMEILTNSISGFASDGDWSKLSIDYNVSLHGLMESRNLLDIEIRSNN